MTTSACPSWVPTDPAVPHADREPCTLAGPHPIGLDGHPIHTAGLHARYHVARLHDRAGKHTDCRYFVLDPAHDLHARVALAAYADSVAQTRRVHPYWKFWGWQLVRDLRAWLRRIDRAEAPR